MLLFKFFPLQIDIIISQIQSVRNILLIRTVKDRRRHIKSQRLCRQGKVYLQYLPDIHSGRHAQRIEYNIQRPAVWQIRHILHWQHTGNHTLITVTACHLVAHGKLSLLRDINADRLIYTG